jgi:hypothetical protein
MSWKVRIYYAIASSCASCVVQYWIVLSKYSHPSSKVHLRFSFPLPFLTSHRVDKSAAPKPLCPFSWASTLGSTTLPPHSRHLPWCELPRRCWVVNVYDAIWHQAQLYWRREENKLTALDMSLFLLSVLRSFFGILVPRYVLPSLILLTGVLDVSFLSQKGPNDSERMTILWHQGLDLFYMHHPHNHAANINYIGARRWCLSLPNDGGMEAVPCPVFAWNWKGKSWHPWLGLRLLIAYQ